MSFDAVIGRIDQILALQQQVSDPSAATGASTTAAGASSSRSVGTSASSFADMLSSAQQPTAMSDAIDPTGVGETDGLAADGVTTPTALTDPISSGVSDGLSLAGLQSATGGTALSGATDLTGLTGTIGLTGTTDTTGAPAQVQSMLDTANALVGKPYVWGGGHSGWGEQSGYDCSGFVSAVLHSGGYLSSPQDTQTLPSQAGIENGPGQYVTIYDRTDAGLGNDHVIIDLGGQFYESGGEAGSWGGGGGVQKLATPSASYLASFNRTLHPEGL